MLARRTPYAATNNDYSTVRGGGSPLGTLEIIPRTDFSFNVAASTVTDVPLAIRVDTTSVVSGVLLVRLHAKSFTGATAQAFVRVQNVSYSDDEPNVLFIDTGAANVAQATIANGDTAPKLYTIAFTAPIGNMVRVLLEHSQGTAAGVCTMSLSCELVLRDA
jgi:hypothetical protein